MTSRVGVLIVAVAALGVMRVAQTEFSPLDGLATLRDFRAMRASSSDPNREDANGHARSFASGQTLTLAELQGPGRIAHIWFTIAHSEAGQSSSTEARPVPGSGFAS